MQSDGNLVIYTDGAEWAAGVGPGPGSSFKFTQGAGALEIVAEDGPSMTDITASLAGNSTWCVNGTSPGSIPGELLVLQPSDGNLVLYGGEPFGPLWAAMGRLPDAAEREGQQVHGQLDAAAGRAMQRVDRSL
jgi:hypothetical protein